jgi:dTDP-4-dehydrorhamnose reductase
MLGRAALAELKRRGVDATGADVSEMDVADAGRVRAVVGRLRPGTVINCAAFTAVDACEAERDLCFKANATGAGNVAEAAAAVGGRVIHLSTDYVFDGKSRVPYTEDAEPAPLSAYGQSKLEGERLVAEAARDHLIVRTAGLFGVGGVSFVSKILARAKDGGPLEVVNDQWSSPTYAGHLAEALAELLDVDFRGIVHVAGAGVASWYDVATEVLKLTGSGGPPTRLLGARLRKIRRADGERYAALAGRAEDVLDGNKRDEGGCRLDPRIPIASRRRRLSSSVWIGANRRRWRPRNRLRSWRIWCGPRGRRSRAALFKGAANPTRRS